MRDMDKHEIDLSVEELRIMSDDIRQIARDLVTVGTKVERSLVVLERIVDELEGTGAHDLGVIKELNLLKSEAVRWQHVIGIIVTCATIYGVKITSGFGRLFGQV